MSNVPQARDFERIRYWQGQLLRSYDLDQQVKTDLQLRQWHNRAVHHAYGVSFGFEATQYSAVHLDGFTFKPGVAHDCYGRALILTRPMNVPLPIEPLGPSLTLVVRASEPTDIQSRGENAEVCLGGCDDSVDGRALEFVWVPSTNFTPRAGVPLVRIDYESKTLARRDSTFKMLIPPAEERPYLANGSTIPGNTSWQIWFSSQGRLGIETVVDTSAGGFGATPCYFATLRGVDLGIENVTTSTLVITHVEQPQPNQFLFRILAADRLQLADLRRASEVGTPRRTTSFPFFVEWIGCESRQGSNRCLRSDTRKSCC
jgi:hypothetical protein